MNRIQPIILASVALVLGGGSRAAPAGDSESPDYVGSQECAKCHEGEYARWHNSHHDLAMTEATDETMLGGFAGTVFTAHGVTSTFYRKNGGYFVRTDGPDGKLHDYRIKYTFGWVPLQQYLIEFPGGRLQCLGIAWDSRPAEQGGRRWFHLYPDEKIDHKNRLHWTGRDQNWNYQCAECHSTDLQKHYNLETDSFKTTWAEIDVACEACHGPGARHVALAKGQSDGQTATRDSGTGLLVDLKDRGGGVWIIGSGNGVPSRRSVPRTNQTKIETCARCHSRRGQIHAEYSHGKNLGNTHRLSLLEEPLYHSDGQIKEEVYVYGSFIQSSMYRVGVTCTDCHDAHSLRLKAEGNLLCAQCHEAQRYDTVDHHRHPIGSAGATCIACHMPQQTYMVIDERADHSMRIPRPDLSLKLGTPNACNQCHQHKSIQWAVEATNKWYGNALSKRPHFGAALHAGRTGALGASQQLLALSVDLDQPGIARASAVDLLRGYAAPSHLLTVDGLLKDDDPLMRAAAARYLQLADPQTALRLGYPLLTDPIRAVRLAAVRSLARLLAYKLQNAQEQKLTRTLDAYRAAELVNAERAESHLNIGQVEAARGNLTAAQQACMIALRLDTAFVPGYINLADIRRSQGRDHEGERILRKGLQAAPDNADLHHALGLLLVRRAQHGDGLIELKRAASLAPEVARYAYVYAIALNSTGKATDALAVLEAARLAHPADRDILISLVTTNRDHGDPEAAEKYARLLTAHHPDDPQAHLMLQQLSNGGKSRSSRPLRPSGTGL